MAEYSWTGIDRTGIIRTGIQQAASPSELKIKLFEQGIALLSYHTQNSIFKMPSIFAAVKTISPQELSIFFHYLALLQTSGIPLANALSLTKNYIHTSFLKKLIGQISDEVTQGETFSHALEKRPQYFSAFIISMVKSGEKSGALPQALEHISAYLTQQHSTAQKLRQAMILPLITFFLAALITMSIFVFIIPQFESLFISMHQELPASTKFILKISSFFTNESTRTGLIIVFLLLLIALKSLNSWERWQAAKSRVTLHIPVIKNLVIFSNIINVLHILSLMLKSGQPLKESLNYASQACTNPILQEQIHNLAIFIDEGKSLEQACRKIKSSYIPENLIASIAMGEQTGNLEIMLEKNAELFQDQLDHRMYLVTTLFQPIILIILGLFIAGIMLAIYIPVFNSANIM